MDHQLLVFKTVADKRSFSQAAKLLHISQPAISLQVQSLEEQIGTRLFDRNNKRVVLTQAGKIFYQRVTQILEMYEIAQKEVSELTGMVKGKIGVGATLTIGEYILPRIAGHFIKEHSQVNMSIQVENTEIITEKLLHNTLDIGLIEGRVDHSDLVSETFMEDELVVIIPFDHPWAKKDYITSSALLTQPFIHREEGSGTRDIVEKILRKHSIDPQELQVSMELGSTQAIKEAVEAGLGFSIISKLAIKKDLKLKTLAMTRVSNCSFNRDLHMVYHKNHFKTQAMETFLKYLKIEDLHRIIEVV